MPKKHKGYQVGEVIAEETFNEPYQAGKIIQKYAAQQMGVKVAVDQLSMQEWLYTITFDKMLDQTIASYPNPTPVYTSTNRRVSTPATQTTPTLTAVKAPELPREENLSPVARRPLDFYVPGQIITTFKCGQQSDTDEFKRYQANKIKGEYAAKHIGVNVGITLSSKQELLYTVTFDRMLEPTIASGSDSTPVQPAKHHRASPPATQTAPTHTAVKAPELPREASLSTVARSASHAKAPERSTSFSPEPTKPSRLAKSDLSRINLIQCMLEEKICLALRPVAPIKTIVDRFTDFRTEMEDQINPKGRHYQLDDFQQQRKSSAPKTINFVFPDVASVCRFIDVLLVLELAVLINPSKDMPALKAVTSQQSLRNTMQLLRDHFKQMSSDTEVKDSDQNTSFNPHPGSKGSS